MTDAPLDQIAYWNGEVGRRWARHQRALDAVFAPLTEALFERAALRAGAGVLDIGCGAGETALIAANRLGSRGMVVAADVSAPMLAVAQGRVALEAAGGAPIQWIEADAETHDLGDARFEHALSRFGVMFFTDSQKAFANLRRALVPGGSATFLCWRRMEENAWISVPRDVVLPMIPDVEPPPADGPGPFRFAERERLETVLSGAGFRDVAIEPLDRQLVLGKSAHGSSRDAAETAARFVVELGPVSRLLRDREPALRDRAFEAVAQTFAGHAEGGAVGLGAACWLVHATR